MGSHSQKDGSLEHGIGWTRRAGGIEAALGELTHRHILAAMLFFLIIVIVSATSYHDWAGDYAHYLLAAINIATGAPYADTPYIYHEVTSLRGPATVMPGMPLLEAVQYPFFGLDLYGYKIVNALLLCASGGIFYKLMCRDWPRETVIGALCMIFVTPYIAIHSDRVYTEWPFLFWMALSLYVTRVLAERDDRLSMILLSVAAGAFIYMAYATRPFGGILIGVLCLYCFFQGRHFISRMGPALIIFWSAYALQKAVLADPIGYSGAVSQAGLHRIPYNAFQYLFSIYDLQRYRFVIDSPVWIQIMGSLVGLAVFFLFYFMLIVFLRERYVSLRRNRPGARTISAAIRKLDPLTIFFGAYVAVLLVMPSADRSRYMLPGMPFLYVAFAYLLYVTLPSLNFWPVRVSRLIIYMVICSQAIMFFVNTFVYKQEGIGSEATQNLFQFVREELPDDEVVAFSKARILVLHTGQKASFTPPDKRMDELFILLDDVGASYVIAVLEGSPIFSKPLREMIRTHPERFPRRIYENTQYAIYAYRKGDG